MARRREMEVGRRRRWRELQGLAREAEWRGEGVTPEWAVAVAWAAYQRRRGEAEAWEPLPIQRAPAWEDDSWDVWMLRGSRGSGKTEGARAMVLEHLRREGPRARVGVGAPTISDARDICAEGPSGLIARTPQEFYYHRSLGEARHVKGGYVKFLGAERPERWNGPQWSLLWCDELALWPKETYEQAQLGLRLGPHPRTIISTTPKLARWVQEIELDPRTYTTYGTLMENKYLSERARERLVRLFQGTHLEKRELLGEWFFESPNALWKEAMFQHVDVYPALQRVVVAVDPAITSGPQADDTGIIAIGVDSHDKRRARGYVLADRTCHVSPQGWAEVAIALYDEVQADCIVAEVNQGGDMVEHTIHSVRPNIPVKKVRATRGKVVRAQPIVALYEQGRMYHVRNRDNLVPLETELCSWDPESGSSPNRLDALVWGATELFLDEADRAVYRLVVGAPVRISAY